jgi:hypothetical protein
MVYVGDWLQLKFLKMLTIPHFIKIKFLGAGIVVHTYNPSYSKG